MLLLLLLSYVYKKRRPYRRPIGYELVTVNGIRLPFIIQFLISLLQSRIRSVARRPAPHIWGP